MIEHLFKIDLRIVLLVCAWLMPLALSAPQQRSCAATPVDKSPIPKLTMIKPFKGDEWGWYLGRYGAYAGAYNVQGRLFFLLTAGSKPLILLDAKSGNAATIPYQGWLAFAAKLDRYRLQPDWGFPLSDAPSITHEGSPGSETFNCGLNFLREFLAIDPSRSIRRKFYLCRW